jgi:hypothetical protein
MKVIIIILFEIANGQFCNGIFLFIYKNSYAIIHDTKFYNF